MFPMPFTISDEDAKHIENDLHGLEYGKNYASRPTVEQFVQRIRSAMYGQDYYRGNARPHNGKLDGAPCSSK